MVKNEQLRDTDQSERVVPAGANTSLSLRPPMFQTTSSGILPRSIDPRAIDIFSIKGRFAWEKIALGDTYIPVIFRGTTKYFCVKMLHKLLPEYPEDVTRRSSFYQYKKPIDLYEATPNEIDLLNRINVHHSHWAYSRQPFTATDELVRVSDFLPFYEHLRLFSKSSPIPRSTSAGSLRPPLPQYQQSMQRSPDFVVNSSNTVRKNPTRPPITISSEVQSHIAAQLSRDNIRPVSRPVVPAPPEIRPLQPPKYGVQSLPPRQSSQNPSIQSQQQLSSSFTQQPVATSSSSINNSTNTAPIPAYQPPKSTTPIVPISSTSPDSVIASPVVITSRKLSTTSSEKHLTSIPRQSSLSPSISKPSRLHCGWLQINKLYTPYVSTNTANHHLYKIPVSLLTFYDLLKIPSFENNTNESKDSSFSSEQISVTPQEIQLINELCIKQNIKPFSIDTKLINLSQFYRYSSATILFVKELPLNEPKASICKDWSSVVQINGGICRLRNMTTLHEQTVPFIGNNLLKNFIISSQCLSSASLTSPTTSEMEFIQLILFFSNISINLNNAKLIDIKSVRKEYNVDLILLFNDKFPLNVLNYQHQGNRPSASQEEVNQSDSSEATNMFAQSTPPPSPLSPPTNNIHVNPSSSLPLTSISASTSSNHYQKTIIFHGHSMTAYICSGLDSNAQRECISVKALCNILYPNSSILDKLETRMLRLLRLKNVSRFRPQNQQSMGITRLIDIKDVEKHWDYIEQGMRSLSNNNDGRNVVRKVSSSVLVTDSKASTLDKVENKSKTIEQATSIEINKGEKRPLERKLEEENMPVLERVDKRVRLSEEDQNEQSKSVRSQSTKTINNKNNHSDDDESEEEDGEDDDVKTPPKPRQISTPSVKIVHQKNNIKTMEKPIQRQDDRILRKLPASSRKQVVPIKKKIILRKRPTPYIRSGKQSIAAWVTKYNIEECCIRLNLYDPIYEAGKD